MRLREDANRHEHGIFANIPGPLHWCTTRILARANMISSERKKEKSVSWTVCEQTSYWEHQDRNGKEQMEYVEGMTRRTGIAKT